MHSVAELEDRLSQPSAALIADLKALDGDIVVLGAGGKLGPSLVRLALRAVNGSTTVTAVSRFGDQSTADGLAAAGARIVSADITDDAALAALPDAPNVVFLVGSKFGSTGREADTWYTNAYLPGRVAERYRTSRIVALSTGNVYPFTSVGSGGPAETTPPGPVGEYAMSCLGRERVMTRFAQHNGTPLAIIRLNYAVEMRYGVLVDIARAVFAQAPVDVTMSAVNVVWQGYANEAVLRALLHATPDPFMLNVCRPRDAVGAAARHRVRPPLRRRAGTVGQRSADGAAVQLRQMHEAVRLPGRAARPAARMDGALGEGRPAAARQAHWLPEARRQVLMTPLELFAAGCAIPAHPLALTAERKLDERRQRALGRYYAAAGAGGMAVGVHTTQFAIHDNGMLRPVLEIAAEVARETARPLVMIAGVQGEIRQAVAEAEQAAELGYHLVLLRPGAGSDAELIERARAVGEVLPIVGFYLQNAVGGRLLSLSFWQDFTSLDCVAGIKIAPFDRYRTLDVLHGVARSGRAREVALYTGNDNSIINDLITPYTLATASGSVALRFVGGLLGQFAVWTKVAAEIVAEARRADAGDIDALRHLLQLDGQLTDANAALFDAANGFRGSIAGINEVLARQGLLAGRWCLDAHEELSPGQADAISRVARDYPHLADDAFVAEHLDAWLR